MSTQDQNTPQQKDARPIWARLRAKATAEAVQPQHYTTQRYTRGRHAETEQYMVP